jgi:hypothetical protein
VQATPPQHFYLCLHRWLNPCVRIPIKGCIDSKTFSVESFVFRFRLYVDWQWKWIHLHRLTGQCSADAYQGHNGAVSTNAFHFQSLVSESEQVFHSFLKVRSPNRTRFAERTVRMVRYFNRSEAMRLIRSDTRAFARPVPVPGCVPSRLAGCRGSRAMDNGQRSRGPNPIQV